MTSVEGNLNSSGLPLFHLRRVGPSPSKDGVVSVMDLYRITYMIGRSAVQVDFYIDSSNHIQSASISRCHARIVRQNGNQHRLYDDSLNGVFVNNMKIAGSCVLREGDKVTFGHPCGARLPAGSRSRQPDSEHQFMFEMCSCDNSKSNRNGARGNSNQETLCFKKPVSPGEASCSKTSSRTKKTARKTTQCFTQDDVRKLKQAWEERQSGSSESDLDSDLDTQAELNIVKEAQQASNVTVPVREQKETLKRAAGIRSNIEPMKASITEQSAPVVHGRVDPGCESSDFVNVETNTSSAEKKEKYINSESSVQKQIGKSALDESNIMQSSASENSANNNQHVNRNTKSVVLEEAEDLGNCNETSSNIETEQCMSGGLNESANEKTSVACEGSNNFEDMEGTFNSILKDLSELRETVENGDKSSSSSEQTHALPTKSPTKDACIQTTQSIASSQDNVISTKSPTKEMGIQTSQAILHESIQTNEMKIEDNDSYACSPIEKSNLVTAEAETDAEINGILNDDESSSVITISDSEETEANVDEMSEMMDTGIESNTEEESKKQLPNINVENENGNKKNVFVELELVENTLVKVIDNEDKTAERTDKGSCTDTIEMAVDDENDCLAISASSRLGTVVDNFTKKSYDGIMDLSGTHCTMLSESIDSDDAVLESEAEKSEIVLSNSIEYSDDEGDENNEQSEIFLSNSVEFSDDDNEIEDTEERSETDENIGIENGSEVNEKADEQTSEISNGSITYEVETSESIVGEIGNETVIAEIDDDKGAGIKHADETIVHEIDDESSLETSVDKTVFDLETDNAYEPAGEEISDDTMEDEKAYEILVDEKVHVQRPYTTESSETPYGTALEETPYETALEETFVDDSDDKTEGTEYETPFDEFDDKTEGTEYETPFDELPDKGVVDTEKDEVGFAKGKDAKKDNEKEDIAESAGNDLIDGKHRTANQFTHETFEKVNANNDNEINRGNSRTGDLQGKVIAENDCSVDKKFTESLDLDRTRPEHEKRSSDYDEMTLSDTPKLVADERLPENDIKRKRKISGVVLEDEASGDSPRKRHCSQDDNVIVSGRREEFISDQACQNADIRLETSHSAEENCDMISSQNTLQKLKTGMKEFFKLWSKKSNNMTETGSTEKGYIYIQDNVGQYKLLELEVPEKSSLNRIRYLDMELDCNNLEKSISEGNEEITNCDSELDSVDEAVEKVCMSRSDERNINDDVGLEKVMCTDSFEPQVQSKTVNVSDEISKVSELIESRTNSGNDGLNKDTVSDVEYVFNSENEAASSPPEIIETSICQTDNEVDINDMNHIIKPSLIAATFRTPFKQMKDGLSIAGSSSPQLLSPVLKQIGSSQNIKVTQLQSPIIAKLGNDTKCTSLSGKLKEKVSKEQDDVASQLSCNFSDEDENDFNSPEIDFSHLDDNDDDDDHCEDGKELVEDNELEKDELGIEKEGKVNSEDDMTCDEEDARDDEQVDDFDNDDNWSETNNNGRETNDNGSETNDRDKGEGNSDDDDYDILLHGHYKKKTSHYDVDFDFGDSEIESDKETGKPQKSDAELNKNEDGNRNNNNDDEEVTIIDSNFDSESENRASVRPSVKRKCNFDTDPWFSKRQNTQENEHLPSTSTPLKTATTDITTPFKTPVAFSKSRLSVTPAKPSPDPFSSTQMIESSQTPDLDSLTMTQMSEVTKQLEVKVTDRTKSNVSRTKAKDLLEKLRAKRRIKEEASSEFPSSSPTGNSSQSTEIELYSRTNNTRRSDAQLALLSVEKHVASCKVVINKLKSVFDGCKSLHGNPRVQAWRKELIDVEKRLVFPKTVIAVVGDTGAGKSSLMNAILDHRSVLPTSGMRACTAVVVEVVQNTTSTYLEADIEFLQRKEWFDELQILLKDLTGLDGNIKKGVPDPTSDAFVSYCKVKAVYGKVDRFEVLSRLTTVTHWLDRVKVIKSKDPEEFRRLVEKYIETQEPGAGGQYWPIVKHVRLRLPNCDVCSSGAALVDLPGVRDSNAARDKIAKEYLKNCTAVWVVSSIHRAIDDKTAKDLLGENFRRQLLMDGQYGSIAFICTKTDVLMPSEIIRTLKLEGETKEHEDQVNAMEAEKSDLELTISKATQEIRRLPKHIASLKKEVAELRDTLREVNNLLDPVDLEGSMSEEQEAIKEYEDEIKQKEEEITTSEDKIDQLHIDKQEASQKIMELENRLNVHRKAIAAICARARNEYSKSQIKRDFKAGLKEMKRRAGMLNNDDDEEDDLFSDDSNDDDDDEFVGSSAENLKVFCCSSTEYQKMKNLLTDDGPPQVFSSLDDTQIPALRHYVHEMTSVRQKHSMERLIKNLGRFVSDVHMYISGGVDIKSGNRHFAKDTIDEELEKFSSSLSPVFEMLSAEISGVFDGSLRQKMEEGATNAADEANDTCAKWGRPYIRDRNEDKKQGGLHFATYRATVRRQGVYTSPTWGPVDFNEDLSEPMYRSMTIVWDRAFSGMLWRILDKLPEQILAKLKQFTIELVGQLENLGITRDRGLRVSSQLHGSAATKLTEMVGQLKELITNKQRDISRLVTPHVQASLNTEYQYCECESGQGMFMRIKACLARGIDGKRMTMFDEATRSLMTALVELQKEVEEYVRLVCQSLIQDLRRAFEPLWEAPSNSVMLRSVFSQPISEASEAMHRIYDDAGLPHTEEYAIVPAGLGTIATGNPAGQSHTVGSCGADGWQTFEKSFQKTENTEYGTKEQAGQLAVRVKTEKISSTCVSQTMETVSRVQTLHIKQEKPDLALDAGCASDFGFRTLQDLQSGKLEISPVEVTVQIQPACSNTDYRPSKAILTVPKPGSVPSQGINKPLSSSHVHSATHMPKTFSVMRDHTPTNIQQSLLRMFPTNSSHSQPNPLSLAIHNKETTSSQVFNQLHKTVNGVAVLKQQPTVTNSAPNLQQQQIMTKRTPNNKLPATSVNHMPVTVNSILIPGQSQTTNNRIPVVKSPAETNSTRSENSGISQQGVIGTMLLQPVKSATVGSQPGGQSLKWAVVEPNPSGQSVKSPTVESHQSVQSVKSATGSVQTPGSSNYTISASTPKLNMVVGIENIAESPNGKENGITSSQKRALKGKKLSGRASLSLSQRNSPVHPEPAPVIKTEPADNGLYGRINRPKFLGTIDLTDELPELD